MKILTNNQTIKELEVLQASINKEKLCIGNKKI